MTDGADATFLIETPEQLRAVADPLRQRLLQAFAEPRTVREVAGRLGEKVTKLYHHVDQLLAAGLVKVVREEKRRAVIERSFQVSARRFAVSPAAFGGGGESLDRKRTAIVRAGVEEMLAAASSEEGAFRLARVHARLSVAALERIEGEIARLVREAEDPAAPPVDLLLLSSRRGGGGGGPGPPGH
jgi:DNA-binding transcriptional ArsR family regulator